MNRLLVAALAAASLCVAGSASAAVFSFTGNLSGDNDVQFFNFSVGASSTVTLRTWSYAGGTNAAGQLIAEGGFDPILSLYDASGNLITYNDDGGANVAADSITGAHFDTFLSTLLSAGNFTVAVSQYSNFGPTHIPGVFPGSGTTNFTDVTGHRRDSHWAFDVLNVNSAVEVGGGVPEPATWALMITGIGLAGAALRRPRLQTA